MRLYHYYRSSASFRVRIALALKGVDWTSAPVNLGEGEQHGEDYGQLVPSRLVPMLEDGGRLIAQSAAIIEYLDETVAGPPLLPREPVGRAFVRELSLDVACDVHPLNNTRVIRRLTALGVDEPGREAWAQHWAELGLEAIERKLQRRSGRDDFCYGDAPTMADCFLVPQVVNARRVGFNTDGLALITGVFNRCMKMQAFAENHPLHYVEEAHCAPTAEGRRESARASP